MHSRARSFREERRATPGDRSVAQLLADLIRNLQGILRAEIRLAQARAREELRTYRPSAAMVMMGVLGGFLSVFFLLLAAVAALSLVIPVWAAALIVAVCMAAVCVLLLRVGTNRVRERAAKIAEHVDRMNA